MTLNSKCDLGCGLRKTEGFFGVDIYPYEGVDFVQNLGDAQWKLETDRFEEVVCRHVIEHVQDMVHFMSEVHRICQDGALVTFETPHFSSMNSWSDPTHRLHLSSYWYENFQPGHWLAAQAGAFALVRSEVTFGLSLKNKIGHFLYKRLGAKKWEKNYAFSYPGMDIKTVLKVVK